MFPWPWDDSSVDEIRANHILEHLGETVDVFLGIIKEIYRVCKSGAKITVVAPHPRHDDFINDPTHVRAITRRTFELFSKRINRIYAESHSANTALGMYLDVDFEIRQVRVALDEPWATQFNEGKITADLLNDAVKKFNNVVKETMIVLEVVK